MKIKLLLLFFLGFYSVFSAQNTDFKIFKIADGLPESNINSIVQDKIGSLYFGTKNSGIVRFDGKYFEVINEKLGLISNSVNAVFYKNDSLVIATDKGVSLRTNNQILNFESEPVLKILNIKNQFYFLTKKGISTFKNDKIFTLRFPVEIENQQINDVVFDGNQFWIATQKNLFKADDLLTLDRLEKIADGNFTSLLFYGNKLVFSDFNRGLFTLENEKIKKINSNLNITKINKIEDELWILVKNNGIEVLKSTNFSFIKKINKYNSLQTNSIHSIFKDSQNTIWFTSDIGLYQFKSKNQNLTKKPIIAFEHIEVVYQSLDSIKINSYDKILQLNPNQNHISFSYKSVDLLDPNSILYRYKLNNRFSPWTKNSSVNFANLEAGNYIFYVQSKNKTQKSELKKFSFFIDTPFYQKTIFQILLFVGVLLLILLISIFNMYRLKRKNKAKIEKLTLENYLITLEQKAMQLQMNPHFIFNILNGIKAYGVAGKTTEFSNTISKFATLLRSILNNSKQEEISLENEIETLKNYIELEQQISPFKFEYEILKSLQKCSEEEILIPPMLLQPFVENAIQHAFNQQTVNNLILISFENKNGFLYCSVQDNGVGIFIDQQNKVENNHKSLAIEITKERIKNITKYNMFIVEEIKEKDETLGTKISFKIPLKTDY